MFHDALATTSTADVLLSKLCENAKQSLHLHLIYVCEVKRNQPLTHNEIEIGTIVSFVTSPQPPEYFGLGIIVGISDSGFR